MAYFGHFYLDREKDIIVELSREGEHLFYTLRTPNHHSGNLITNFAKLCGVPLSEDETGLKIIRGEVPSYIDGDNRELFALRFGGTKVANIYPDGRIERKAAVPAIAKTLMSQTKDYKLDLFRTLVKTYIFTDCKFRTDLHTHMNAILEPDILIALGIAHQIRYPLYYVKKLDLKMMPSQWDALMRQRETVAARFEGKAPAGKYLERKIDDNCFINFADLIVNNLPHAAENIPKIRASLAVLKDGQAVFSNLERVYLYRYVFTKGIPAAEKLPPLLVKSAGERIPDEEIAGYLKQMLADDENPAYRDNTLFQDKLLWIARSYAKCGITYAEISDTSLVKADQAAGRLAEMHRILPKAQEETGVMLRFLAGIRRTPLTIVKDNIAPSDYLKENLRVLQAVADDPYVAGCDILGEEINDINELKPFLREVVALSGRVPGFVIRIHAGECDSLKDNVEGSLLCVREALAPGQAMPPLRIGHGLYTSNLRSAKGRQLLAALRNSGAVLEFQLSSNVRLNNLSRVENHPLKQYLHAGVACVQGTDGGALYGTNSIDEELALERLLSLSREDLRSMCATEKRIMTAARDSFVNKEKAFRKELGGQDIREFWQERIEALPEPVFDLPGGALRLETASVLFGQFRELPEKGLPVIVAGGSFNNSQHRTSVRAGEARILDELLEKGDPAKLFFVIGHRVSAYEKYLLEKNAGRFAVFAIVPTYLTRSETARLKAAGVGIRVSIEPNGMGIYKSFTYEIFKRRPSVLLAFDGNAAGTNLIQEAKNARFPCRIYVSAKSRTLRSKTQSLEGYVRLFEEGEEVAAEILRLL